MGFPFGAPQQWIFGRAMLVSRILSLAMAGPWWGSFTLLCYLCSTMGTLVANGGHWLVLWWKPQKAPSLTLVDKEHQQPVAPVSLTSWFNGKLQEPVWTRCIFPECLGRMHFFQRVKIWRKRPYVNVCWSLRSKFHGRRCASQCWQRQLVLTAGCMALETEFYKVIHSWMVIVRSQSGLCGYTAMPLNVSNHCEANDHWQILSTRHMFVKLQLWNLESENPEASRLQELQIQMPPDCNTKAPPAQRLAATGRASSDVAASGCILWHASGVQLCNCQEIVEFFMFVPEFCMKLGANGFVDACGQGWEEPCQSVTCNLDYPTGAAEQGVFGKDLERTSTPYYHIGMGRMTAHDGPWHGERRSEDFPRQTERWRWLWPLPTNSIGRMKPVAWWSKAAKPRAPKILPAAALYVWGL